jgi:hypothetical protein
MISVFLPCYNEEKIFKKHVLVVYSILKKLKYDFELVIVNDSSNDNTGEIADELHKKYHEIKHFYYKNGPSRRENLAESFKKANGDIVIFMDIDLAVDLKDFKKLVTEIEKGADIVIGNRRAHDSVTKRKIFRKIISFIYHKSLKLYFNSKINDYQCGFKSFKKEVILNLNKKIGYDYSFKRGWFWDAEMLIVAEKLNYKIKQLPVIWNEGKASTFNIKRELRMMPYVFLLKFKKYCNGKE